MLFLGRHVDHGMQGITTGTCQLHRTHAFPSLAGLRSSSREMDTSHPSSPDNHEKFYSRETRFGKRLEKGVGSRELFLAVKNRDDRLPTPSSSYKRQDPPHFGPGRLLFSEHKLYSGWGHTSL